jgi:16S rRNA U1498 N3-methylase RsmE
LMKIAKEAIEQSWWRNLPLVTFSSDINEWIKNTKLTIFDKSWNVETLKDGNVMESFWNVSTPPQPKASTFPLPLCGIIGPEGWLTPIDYKRFEAVKPEIRDLGDTILRMETASIIGAWILKNC